MLKMNIVERIKAAIRDIPDFPKPGIIFKDITPILLDAKLCNAITDHILESITEPFDAIVGVESRGFLFGLTLANKAGVPFIPARKKGKLPGKTEAITYNLEYGTATIEIHKGHIKPGTKVLVHDDLLATGGTAKAAADLVQTLNAEVAAFSFLVDLSFLNGREKLEAVGSNIYSIVTY